MLTENRSSQDIPVCITLVHGTIFFSRTKKLLSKFFGRNKGWSESGSQFQRCLSEELHIRGIKHFYSDDFFWSGAQSIAARYAAAKELTEHIGGLQYDRHMIIAHSHGGNVASLATQNLDNLCDISVVALATPFVEVTGTDSSIRVLDYLLVSSIGLTVYLVLIRSYLSRILGSDVSRWVVNRLLNPVPDLVIAGIIIGLTALLLKIIGIRGTGKSAKEIQRKTAGATNWRLASNLLVLRTIDDEASLAIYLGALSHRMLFTVGFVLRKIFTALYFVLMAIMYSYRYVRQDFIKSNNPFIIHMYESQGMLPQHIVWLKTMSWISFITIVLLSTLCLAAIALASFFKSFYGTDLLLGAVTADINSQSVPDITRRNVDVISLPATPFNPRSLRHFIYENPHCIPAIGEWLTKIDQQRSNPI